MNQSPAPHTATPQARATRRAEDTEGMEDIDDPREWK